MKKLIVFAITIISVGGFAQNRPLDFKLIKKNNTDKSSALYYPALLKRYMANDTALSAEEYRQLYYGSAFQKDYDAYGEPEQKDELKKLFAKDGLNDDDIKAAIALENASLKKFPFLLQTLSDLAQLYDLAKDSANSRLAKIKLTGIVSAMSTTGDALSDSTAMSVISVDDEYTLIRLLGFRFGGSQALITYKGREMDKMSLRDNENYLKFLYFDVGILFNSMSNMFEKKKN